MPTLMPFNVGFLQCLRLRIFSTIPQTTSHRVIDKLHVMSFTTIDDVVVWHRVELMLSIPG